MNRDESHERERESVRRAVESRFEPLTIEGWQKTYYASPVDFGGGVSGSQPDIH